VHDVLRKILAEKQRELRQLAEDGGVQDGQEPEYAIRDFGGAISKSGGVNLIAEIKFASPSAGAIRKDLDPVTVGKTYQAAGAAAISLLTDKTFFGGDLRNLPRLKEAVSLPILRKDFIVDEIQVRQSYTFGADAILLIARILPKQKLRHLLTLCRELGMAALTEVHDRDDLTKAIDCGANIIGINNRDLDTFTVDLKTTVKLIPLVPHGHVIVSESGIHHGEDIQVLKEKGTHAVLIGTALMKSADVMKKAEDLIRAGKRN
jgi:indole-3-glycerol phosphate synthase